MQKMLLRCNGLCCNKKTEDYVISSDKNHSVREFVEISADFLGFKIKWHGKG